MELFCLCESCSDEIELKEGKMCNLCDLVICENCYDEYQGYCPECYSELVKERTEEEKLLWKAFWESRF